MLFKTTIVSGWIDVDRDIRSGVPVLSMTRIPLSQILAEIADRRSIVEIADDLSIEVDAIEGFIQDLGRSFEKDMV